jgi:hypothetical protein
MAVRPVKSTLFPQTLNRCDYFVRLLIFIAILVLLWLAGAHIPVPKWIGVIITGGLCLTRIFCLDIPRLRSMRWSVWISPLMLTPAVFILQFFLLFVPPRMKAG